MYISLLLLFALNIILFLLGKIDQFFFRFINVKAGIIGAIIMGGIIYYINSDHPWPWPMVAALKQAIYSFFAGGIVVRLLQYFLTNIKNRYLNIPLSVLLTTTITTIAVFFVHSMKGTPEPFMSTVPTMVLSPFGFLALSIKFKKSGNFFNIKKRA